MKRFTVYFSAIAALACVAAPGVSALPPDRAYELVSPPATSPFMVPAADDGGEVVSFLTRELDRDPNGLVGPMIGLARRTATGWETADASARNADLPTGHGPVNAIPQAFSADWTRLIFSSDVPFASDDQDGQLTDSWATEIGSGTATFLTRGEPDNAAASIGSSQAAGSSADARTFVFGSTEPLLPEAPPSGTWALYERTPDDELRIVSVLPDGTVTEGSRAMNPGAWSGNDGIGGNGGPTNPPIVAPHGGGHPVSDDGSRIFWVTDANAFTPSPLYLRENGTTTIPISVSHATADAGTVQPARFIAATHDGSIVYFTSPVPLTDDAPPSGMSLYRYDLEVDDLDSLTPSIDPTSFQRGIVSDDGTHVYFTDTAVLAPGATPGGQNAYVWDAVDGIRFILRFPATTSAHRVVRVSRDGRYALIVSTGAFADAPPSSFRKLYLYDAENSQLACVSCHPDGLPATAHAEYWPVFPATFNSAVQRPRNITDDGEVFFQTNQPLVSGDLNSVADVYLFDDGELALISSGRGDYPSYVSDSSDDGDSVFFLTRDALVAADGDDGSDLYAARVGGGFPEAPPAPKVPSCQEQGACQETVGAPRFADLGSAFVQSGGDEAGPVRAAFRALGLSRVARARLAQGRRGALRVRVNRAGRVSVTVRARLRGSRRVVASGSRVASSNGTVRVPLKLSRAALDRLRRSGPLRLQSTVRFAGSPETVRLSVLLKRIPSKSNGR